MKTLSDEMQEQPGDMLARLEWLSKRLDSVKLAALPHEHWGTLAELKATLDGLLEDWTEQSLDEIVAGAFLVGFLSAKIPVEG